MSVVSYLRNLQMRQLTRVKKNLCLGFRTSTLQINRNGPGIKTIRNSPGMASTVMAPTISSFSTKTSIKEYKMSHITPRKSHSIKAMRAEKPLEELYKGHSVNATREEKPLEELYNVRVERKVPPERLVELGVLGWSMWKTGKCKLPWNWHVDQFVYIEEGEVRVVPEGSHRFMRFLAGDLVRYPKWFEADLFFNGFYQERYSFRAYGDDY